MCKTSQSLPSKEITFLEGTLTDKMIYQRKKIIDEEGVIKKECETGLELHGGITQSWNVVKLGCKW